MKHSSESASSSDVQYALPASLDPRRRHLLIKPAAKPHQRRTVCDEVWDKYPDLRATFDIDVFDNVAALDPNTPLPLLVMAGAVPESKSVVWFARKGVDRVLEYLDAQLQFARTTTAPLPPRPHEANAFESERAPRPRQKQAEGRAKQDSSSNENSLNSVDDKNDASSDDDAPAMMHTPPPSRSRSRPLTSDNGNVVSPDNAREGEMITDAEGNVIGTALGGSCAPPKGYNHKYTKEEVQAFLAERNQEDADLQAAFERNNPSAVEADENVIGGGASK